MSKKKQRSSKDRQIEILKDQLEKNGVAMAEDKKRKNWSVHDIKTIRPLNEPQEQMFRSYFQGNHVIANGSAGTGKTFAALYLALNDILSKERPQKKLIIVRSPVTTRDIGHLPGTREEKLEPYENPYRDILSDLVGNLNTYDDMKEARVIEFMPTSHIRGLNWDDCVVVVDEVQNLNFHEINSVITRLGEGSRLIVVGDLIQSDLYKTKFDSSGMDKFLEIAEKVSEFDEVMFGPHDIVRSDFVKSWICALEDHEGIAGKVNLAKAS